MINRKTKKRIALLTFILFIISLLMFFCVHHILKNKDSASNLTSSDNTNSSSINEEYENMNISYSTDESFYDGLTYDYLLQKLNDISNEKEFDDIEFEYSKIVFDSLYEHYDDWKNSSKDFPSKEKYIFENLFEPLNSCVLNFISTESDEGRILMSNDSAMGFTERVGDKAKVTILYNPDEEGTDLLTTAERFLHELAHVNQIAIVFNDIHFKQYPYLSYIMTEGGATFKMKMMNQCMTEKMGAGYIESGDVTLEYKIDNGEGYPKEMNYYCHLQYLAGYDVMEGVIKGDSVSNIEKRISVFYGEETSKRVFSLLKNIEMADLEENYEEEFNYSLELENLFLECVKKDIDKLKTKKEIEAFTNIYRAYMIHLLPRLYMETYEDITYKDVTYEPEYLVKAKELDEYMAEKICTVEAFDISDIITADSLLHTSIDNVYERPGDYYWAFVPPNLYKTDYLQKEDGSLILGYYNYKADDEPEYVYLHIKKDRSTSEVFTELLYAEVDIDSNDLSSLY